MGISAAIAAARVAAAATNVEERGVSRRPPVRCAANTPRGGAPRLYSVPVAQRWRERPRDEDALNRALLFL